MKLFAFPFCFVINLCLWVTLWASVLFCVNSKDLSKINGHQVADPRELQSLAMAVGGPVKGEARGASEPFSSF